jgi:hypothetical protein
VSYLPRFRLCSTVATSDESNAIEVTVETRSPDLDLVDALARLQLMARRRGCSIQLRPSDELRELLLLVGLSKALSVEARRETEEGKELGVEEVVQPGDPPV